MSPLLLVLALAVPDTIRITEGWAAPTPPGAPTAAAYLSVENVGRKPDRLIGVTSPDAARAEVHGMDISGGVMRMRAYPVLDIPAGGRLTLQPTGGRHIMLIAPKRRLVNGDRVTAALTFQSAGRRIVTLPVRAR